MRLVIEPGTCTVMVGASAADIQAETTITCTGDEVVLGPPPSPGLDSYPPNPVGF
jgi:hypothetical protein